MARVLEVDLENASSVSIFAGVLSFNRQRFVTQTDSRLFLKVAYECSGIVVQYQSRN